MVLLVLILMSASFNIFPYTFHDTFSVISDWEKLHHRIFISIYHVNAFIFSAKRKISVSRKLFHIYFLQQTAVRGSHGGSIVPISACLLQPPVAPLAHTSPECIQKPPALWPSFFPPAGNSISSILPPIYSASLPRTYPDTLSLASLTLHSDRRPWDAPWIHWFVILSVPSLQQKIKRKKKKKKVLEFQLYGRFNQISLTYSSYSISRLFHRYLFSCSTVAIQHPAKIMQKDVW